MKPFLEIALVAGFAAAGAATAAWAILKKRRDPAERERRRRALIAARGRLIEGEVLDFHDGVIYYSYSWRGVEYEASQDLNGLAAVAPDSPESVVGPVTVKFLPGDASNSIVLSEDWSGLSRRAAAPRTAD